MSRITNEKRITDFINSTKSKLSKKSKISTPSNRSFLRDPTIVPKRYQWNRIIFAIIIIISISIGLYFLIKYFLNRYENLTVREGKDNDKLR